MGGGKANGSFGSKEGVNPDMYGNRANDVLNEALQKAITQYNFYSGESKKAQISTTQKALNSLREDDRIKLANLDQSKSQVAAYMNPLYHSGMDATSTLRNLYGMPGLGDTRRQMRDQMGLINAQRMMEAPRSSSPVNIMDLFGLGEDLPMSYDMLNPQTFHIPVAPQFKKGGGQPGAGDHMSDQFWNGQGMGEGG